MQCKGWARGRGVCHNQAMVGKDTCYRHHWQKQTIDMLALTWDDVNGIARAKDEARG